MSEYNDLLNRITEGLSGDRELQAEIARELQAHLDDAATEFRAGGCDAPAAREQAVKALGDPDDLGRGLLLANMHRMKVRSVLRWSARVALLPLAFLVIAMLGISTRASSVGNPGPISPAAAARLTPDQRLILLGDPSQPTLALRDKAIVDRWPDNPVYYANYFARAVPHGYGGPPLATEDLQQALDLAKRGEQVDPSNAMYNFMAAAWMISVASEVQDDPTHKYVWRSWRGETAEQTFWQVTIKDQGLFDRGVAELRRGLAKPLYNTRIVELVDERVALIGPPQRFNDFLRMAAVQVSTVMSDSSCIRNVGKALAARAVQLAQAGDPDAATLARDVEAMACKIGGQTYELIELLVAKAVRDTGMVAQEFVAEELHQPEAVAAAKARRLAVDESRNRALGAQGDADFEQQLKHAGMLWGVLKPSLPGYHLNVEPLRTTEYFVMMELALSALLIAIVWLAVIVRVASLRGRFRKPRDQRPMLIFVGWRRIGRILLVSLGVPLAVYSGYILWQALAPDAYGLNYSLGRVLLELTTVGLLIISLLLATSYRAVRTRCAELGVPTPEPIHLKNRKVLAVLGAVVALACVAYMIAWWAGPMQPGQASRVGLWGNELASPKDSQWSVLGNILPGMMIAIPMLALMLIWLIRETIAMGRVRVFRGTFLRSIGPILCSAVILVGITIGSLLVVGESSAARRVTGDATLSFTREIDASNYRLIREQFRQDAGVTKFSDNP